MVISPSLQVSDLVYLHVDFNKLSAHDYYFVIIIDDPWCNIQEFCGDQLYRSSHCIQNCKCYKARLAVAHPFHFRYDQTGLAQVVRSFNSLAKVLQSLLDKNNKRNLNHNIPVGLKPPPPTEPVFYHLTDVIIPLLSRQPMRRVEYVHSNIQAQTYRTAE